jgi:NAD(P)-dependent dehydrogenase (short-subunit alcohol dehydrogenase family)
VVGAQGGDDDRVALADRCERVHEAGVEAALEQVGALDRAEPEIRVALIAALLSDERAWITGENIEASGGFKL